MKTKNFLFLMLVSLIITNSFSQDCSKDISEEQYKKVMNLDFSEDFEKCPVIITAEFFKTGYIQGLKKPNKLKKGVFFQCFSEGESPSNDNPLLAGYVGDFFVINKENSDKVFDSKKGEKIKIKGTTFTHKYFGKKLRVIFIVESIEKL